MPFAPISENQTNGFYKQLMDSLYDGVYFVDRERRITYWNKSAERLTGYSAAEVMGRCCSDNLLVHVDDSGQQLCTTACPLSQTIGDGQPRDANVHLRHKLGHRVPVAVRVGPICDQQGRIIGAVEVFSDNSAKRSAQRQTERLKQALDELDETNLRLRQELAEHARAEAALSRSEGHLRTIVDNLPMGVWFTDTEGNIVLGNAAAEQIWGGSRMVGAAHYHQYRACWASTGKQVEPQEWGAYRAVKFGETSINEMVEIELSDGRRRTLFDSAFPVKDAQGQILGAVVINEDITERQRAQEALMRAEKLASAGRVAATIAHEVNNPVAAVMNVLYLLRANPSLDDDATRMVTVAEEELRRVASIARNTLGFYRANSARSAVNVGALLDQVVSLYSRKLQENSIQVATRYSPDPEVMANEGELRQVFSNLLSNAIDACSDGGRIYLRIRQRRPPAGKPGLIIAVADSGAGIDPEHLPRLFEPFFTTKATVGTGLGLWVTKTIVQKHGGTIRMRTLRGRGTVFQVFLPAEAAGESVGAGR